MNYEIALEGMEFYAFHGLYPEEQRTGNLFTVDIKVQLPPSSFPTQDALSHTLDYSKLYGYAKEQMKVPAKLLETLAQNLLDTIFLNHPETLVAEVKITKNNPPLSGQVKKVSVKLKRVK